MDKNLPLSYFDVLEACAQPGCPFCRLSEQSVHSYLDALLYEQVNDPGTRGMLRHSLGFCNEHAHQLPDVSQGVALGVALIYRDLIGLISDELQTARYMQSGRLHQVRGTLKRAKPSTATEATVHSLQAREQCPACLHRNTMETLALTSMLEALPKDKQMRSALEASSGLCLPHLRRALELTRDKATFTVLLEIAREKIAKLRTELDEFIRKNDYRFNSQGFGPEGDSWRRAISWLAGASRVR